MLALNASSLLTAWEQGVTQHPLQRAVKLLALAWPQRTVEEWARVSIGERNRQLLQLRKELFGSKFEAVATCSNCGERLELAFAEHDLLAQSAPENTEWKRLECGGFEVNYRLPTSADLLEVTNNPGQARELLLERCVEARAEGVAVSASVLPSEAVKLLGEKMAEADHKRRFSSFWTAPLVRINGPQFSTFSLTFGVKSTTGPSDYFTRFTHLRQLTVGVNATSCR